MWEGYGKKETLVHRCLECKLKQPLCKTEQRFLKKLKAESAYGPAISFLGIYPNIYIYMKKSLISRREKEASEYAIS